MNEAFITFRSVTYAQRGEAILKRAGLECTLRRTPKALADRGCGYSLRIRPRDALAAVMLLRENSVSFGKVFAVKADGKAEELEV